MCEFKIWLTSKYYSKNIDAPDYDYWCNRMVQAYNEGEYSTAVTILDDYNEGLIELSPSDAIIINAFVDAK
jgi:hypothetical protein